MTEPHYRDDNVTLYHGDCLDILAELPDASVDSVVTDPPYGLDFMGKHWDTGAVAFDTAIWGHCLRVLKPGGHLLAFGGTRTWHRLACAVEDAGFEIRDNIAWIYGSGFPKSLDVSKAIDKAAGAEREVVGTRNGAASVHNGPPDSSGSHIWSGNLTSAEAVTDDAQRWQGWGTALKPAFEPVVVARKPLSGTVAANVLAHGTGALNIDGTRVGTDGGTKRSGQAEYPRNADGTEDRSKSWARTGHGIVSTDSGRWPANVLLDPDTAAELDKQSGWQKDGTHIGRNLDPSSHSGNTIYSPRNKAAFDAGYGGEGGASRFFPVFRYNPKAPTDERPNVDGVAHPTVKPLDLMRWLVRLVTPPGGLVLEPFAGSGTTAEACIHEHMRCIAIEREADYLPLIVARLSKPMEIGFDLEGIN